MYLRMCVLRELFEETGMLLHPRGTAPQVTGDWDGIQKRVMENGETFLSLLTE